jgi:glycosyltransferase involved in cell wall biosynthesis
MRNRKIAFVYTAPFWVEDQKIYTDHPAIGRYVEALATHTSRVIVIAPQRADLSSITYPVQASNVTIFPLPAYQNIQQFWFQAVKYYYLLWRAAPEWDMLTIRVPTHLGFPAFLAASWYKKPIFLVVVGESLAVSKLSGFPFLKQCLANLDAWFQDVLMDFMVGHCLTFTNGEDLYQKFNRPGRQIYITRSSTIREVEIESPNKDTCQNSPYKILTVGSVSPLKGPSLIPQVIASLKKKGIKTDWLYIGPVEGNSGKQELLLTMELATKLDVSSSLKFLGPMKRETLFDYYRKCDVFVLPTYMEGVPRVILEAQAAGLPVISTTVGGIPQAVENGKDGLLVTPGRSDEIALAIEKIIRNSGLRQELIRNGIESAIVSTVDAQTSRMFDVVREHFDLM